LQTVSEFPIQLQIWRMIQSNHLDFQHHRFVVSTITIWFPFNQASLANRRVSQQESIVFTKIIQPSISPLYLLLIGNSMLQESASKKLFKTIKSLLQLQWTGSSAWIILKVCQKELGNRWNLWLREGQ
jgi:hypothetical protein